MVFEVLKPRDQIFKLELASTNFWVHVLDLPFGWASHVVDKALGKSLGVAKGVLSEGNSLQLRVTWNIKKPLR